MIQCIFKRYEVDQIRDLGFVRPFTNSEKNYTTCKRQYTYEYVENIKIDGINPAFAYGSCWHLTLEYILKQIKDSDELPNEEVLLDFLKNHISKYIIDQTFEEYSFSSISIEEVNELKTSIKDRILLSITGWLKNWRENIHPKYKVLDVELVTSHPVSYQNEKLVLDTKLVEETYPSDKEEYKKKHVYRLLKTAEQNYSTNPMFDNCLHQQLVETDMPYYKVGKIDAVLLHRDLGSLWVLDHKSTASPSSYERKADYDLQLISYCALLRKDIKNGKYDYIKDKGKLFVGGVIWDICSSNITKKRFPKFLAKSGKISKAKTSLPPSWLLKRTIEEKGLEFSEYEEYYKLCCENDTKFFSLITKHVSSSDLDRIDAEDYSTALRLHKIGEDISSIDYLKPFDWDIKSNRHTVCTNYSSCKFSNFCFANSKSNDILLLREQKLFWISYS
jgi:hypothetical protein